MSENTKDFLEFAVKALVVLFFTAGISALMIGLILMSYPPYGAR